MVNLLKNLRCTHWFDAVKSKKKELDSNVGPHFRSIFVTWLDWIQLARAVWNTKRNRIVSRELGIGKLRRNGERRNKHMTVPVCSEREWYKRGAWGWCRRRRDETRRQWWLPATPRISDSAPPVARTTTRPPVEFERSHLTLTAPSRFTKFCGWIRIQFTDLLIIIYFNWLKGYASNVQFSHAMHGFISFFLSFFAGHPLFQWNRKIFKIEKVNCIFSQGNENGMGPPFLPSCAMILFCFIGFYGTLKA